MTAEPLRKSSSTAYKSFHFRFAVSFQRTKISSKKLEAKLGLPPIPNRAKRPYDRFFDETRIQLVKDNPSLKHTEIIRICAKKWAETDQDVKDRLRKDFLKENFSYQQEIFQYNNRLTEEQKSSIEAEINAVGQNDMKLEHKKVRNEKSTSMNRKLQRVHLRFSNGLRWTAQSNPHRLSIDSFKKLF